MKQLDEIRQLIKNTTFDLDIIEVKDYRTTLLLTTSTCKSGLFLKIRIDETDKIYLSIDLYYGDDYYSLVKRFGTYSTSSVIIALSRIISSTCTVGNNVGNDISKLETNIMLAPSVEWVEIFKNELFNIFKDVEVDRTENLVVHLIGVDFIVKFNEDTNSFSVEVVQTSNPDNSKVLLLGVVCDNNYNKVLSAIRHTFKEAMTRFNNLESISLKIMWGK